VHYQKHPLPSSLPSQYSPSCSALPVYEYVWVCVPGSSACGGVCHRLDHMDRVLASQLRQTDRNYRRLQTHTRPHTHLILHYTMHHTGRSTLSVASLDLSLFHSPRESPCRTPVACMGAAWHTCPAWTGSCRPLGESCGSRGSPHTPTQADMTQGGLDL
jgi:hypothetical protein